MIHNYIIILLGFGYYIFCIAFTVPFFYYILDYVEEENRYNTTFDIVGLVIISMIVSPIATPIVLAYILGCACVEYITGDWSD